MGEENGTRGRYSGDVESKAVDNGQALDIDIGQARTLSADGTPNLLAKHNQLERGLKSRHIQFIALGGAIGTGLFVGSGRILQLVGPAPLFMGYLSMMVLVWNIMNIWEKCLPFFL
ncbi:hypothetical protein MCOR02_000476 [Pyricularia oryzae]|nr:hypothetical protein MCOR02_000476 [Pyricularia oryzae]